MTFQWPENTPVAMVCQNKWFETEDTVSVQIAPENNPKGFDFKPGQFVTVGIELGGKMEYRAYSISSLPGQASLQLTIKRVDQGKVSNHIVDALQVGDMVSVLKPTGSFNSVDNTPKRKVALISAGCGITPVMSMAKQWVTEQSDVEIDFVHMAKSPEQTIYYNELEKLDREFDQFQLKLLLKDRHDSAHRQGRLDKTWLRELCDDILDRTVYLCGPVQFMQDMENNLRELGFDMDNFYQESFTPLETELNPEDTSITSSTLNLSVPAFGKEVELENGATLVDALESAGVPIIVACRSGICGSCKCKVTKGDVKSMSQETLSAQEQEQGYVLACSTTVHSDVEVELG